MYDVNGLDNINYIEFLCDFVHETHFENLSIKYNKLFYNSN